MVPPSVIVTAQFPGANPETIAETVANPIEEQVEGVENMLYMASQSTSDGTMTLTITFKIGTNPDLAAQLVQNRVNQALPRLPQEVQQLGVTTVKSSPDLTMVVHLLSPNNRYDMVYLRNYAVINVKDRLARLPGIGDVRLFGSGDYAMRIWLDPRKIAERGLSADDVVTAIRNQNVDVAAGVIGSSPSTPDVDYQIAVNAQGRLTTPEEFENIVIRTAPNGAVTRLSDVARVELGASEYALRSLLNNKSAVAIPIFQAPGSNALQVSDEVRATMAELAKDLPEGVTYQHRLRSHPVRPRLHPRGHRDAAHRHPARRHRGHRLPADVARLDHPAAGRAGLGHRHLRHHVHFRLLDQHALALRPRAGHRHRRR